MRLLRFGLFFTISLIMPVRIYADHLCIAIHKDWANDAFRKVEALGVITEINFGAMPTDDEKKLQGYDFADCAEKTGYQRWRILIADSVEPAAVTPATCVLQIGTPKFETVQSIERLIDNRGRFRTARIKHVYSYVPYHIWHLNGNQWKKLYSHEVGPGLGSESVMRNGAMTYRPMPINTLKAESAYDSFSGGGGSRVGWLLERFDIPKGVFKIDGDATTHLKWINGRGVPLKPPPTIRPSKVNNGIAEFECHNTWPWTVKIQLTLPGDAATMPTKLFTIAPGQQLTVSCPYKVNTPNELAELRAGKTVHVLGSFSH